MRRSTPFALLGIALLIAVQPLGVFWHFVDDHFHGHSHAAQAASAVHAPDVDGPHHAADHDHVWMPPAASAAVTQMSRPQPIAALRPLEDLSRPSTAPFPPFSPPRA